MLAIALGLCGHNPSALGAVSLTGKAIVTPRSEPANPPLLIHRQHIGVRFDQPFWWRSGRRSHHDLQASRTKRVDRLIKPSPIIVAWLWLHAAPGKLADPNVTDAQLDHFLGILRPDLLRPMFRVVTDAKLHRTGSKWKMASSPARSTGSGKPMTLSNWPLATTASPKSSGGADFIEGRGRSGALSRVTR